MIYSTIIYEFRLLIFYLLLGLFTGACQREAIPLQLWHLVVAAPLVDSLFKHVDELHEESATAWSNPAATGKLFGGAEKVGLYHSNAVLFSCLVESGKHNALYSHTFTPDGLPNGSTWPCFCCDATLFLARRRRHPPLCGGMRWSNLGPEFSFAGWTKWAKWPCFSGPREC